MKTKLSRNKINSSAKSYLPIWLILIASVTRLLPHPPNFAAVGSVSLYSGRYISGWWKYIIPIVAMLITDILLGFHKTMVFVYSCFIINVFLGVWIARKPSIARIAFATISGSTIFYIVTNFGVWLTSNMYPHNASGLLSCYISALPFARYTYLSDIVFTVALFGLTEAIYRKTKKLNSYKKGEELCPVPLKK